MRRILIPCSFSLVVASTWAQEPARKPSAAVTVDAVGEIAARAMEAMDALQAPKISPKSSAPPTTGTGSTEETTPFPDAAPAGPGGPNAIKQDAEDAEDGDPAVLPPASAQRARGIDLASRARLDSMVPVGRSHRGVHYPSYLKTQNTLAGEEPNPDNTAGVAAQLESLFESDVVTRLDDDHLQFEGAKWVQYEEKPAADGTVPPAMTLEIESGVYDLKHEILRTNQPVRIENNQYIIEADAMLHDRASGLTVFTRAKISFLEDLEPASADEPSITPAALPPDEPAEKTATKTTPTKPATK